MLSHKTFFLSAAFIFTLAGALHLVRAFAGWDLQVAMWQVPVWLSWVAGIIASGLAVHAWKFGSKC